MSRVQIETRRHSRAAAVWALVGGAGLAAAGGVLMVEPGTAAARLGAASAHVLAFGMVGDLWLATVLRSLSSQPSKASVSPRLLSLVFMVWNGTVVASALTLLVSSPVRGRGVQPVPFFGTAAALLTVILVAPVVLQRLAGIPPVAYHHLAALAALVVGLGLGDAAYVMDDADLEQATEALVLGGWLPLAGAVLFFASLDYESYEDRRWPLLSVIAIGSAAIMRFSFYYGVFNANGLNFMTAIAGFAVLIGLGTVLRMRWHGGMTYWFERLAFAGVVAVAVSAFLGLDRPFGAPVGPISVRTSLFGPSFFGAIVLWAAAAAVMLDQRDLPQRPARLVMWPVVVGALVYPVAVQFSRRVNESESAARTMLAGGAVAVGAGLVVLAVHLLRRPRLRSVR